MPSLYFLVKTGRHLETGHSCRSGMTCDTPLTFCSYVSIVLIVMLAISKLADEDEAETGSKIGARPRRMSEIKTNSQKLPIPPASSFFIFSPTNR